MNPKTERSYLWLFWGMAVVGLVADQTSKYGIFSHLYNDGEGGKIEIIPGVFQLIAQYSKPPERETGEGPVARLRTVSGEVMPHVNRGALFGLGGRDGTGRDSNHLFAVISVAAALAIVYWITRPSTARDRLLAMSLGLILAGTLGNLFDRLVFEGVRDFLRWYYVVDWPVFNLADCCLVCGASLLLLQAFLAQPQPVTPETVEIATAPAVAEPEVAEAK
jgi:signal peptidase II